MSVICSPAALTEDKGCKGVTPAAASTVQQPVRIPDTPHLSLGAWEWRGVSVLQRWMHMGTLGSPCRAAELPSSLWVGTVVSLAWL